jgi:phage shock protein C
VGSHRQGRFRLNKAEGKVMGVCAGLADHFDIDVSLVRVAVAVGIVMTFPVGLFAYLILAMVAQSGGRRQRQRHGQRQEREAYAPRLSAASTEATRDRMRDLDARMQAIETYVTSSNSSLAKEIDSLR